MSSTPGGLNLDDEYDDEDEEEEEAEFPEVFEAPTFIKYLFQRRFYRRKKKEQNGISNKGRRCKHDFSKDVSIARILSETTLESATNREPWVDKDFDLTEEKETLLSEDLRVQCHSILRDILPVKIRMKYITAEEHFKWGETEAYLQDINPNCRQFVFRVKSTLSIDDSSSKMAQKVKTKKSEDQPGTYEFTIRDAHNVWWLLYSFLPEKVRKEKLEDIIADTKEGRVRGWVMLEGLSRPDQEAGIDNWKPLETQFPCGLRQETSFASIKKEYCNFWPETEDALKMTSSNNSNNSSSNFDNRNVFSNNNNESSSRSLNKQVYSPSMSSLMAGIKVEGLENIWEMSESEVGSSLIKGMSPEMQKSAVNILAKLVAIEIKKEEDPQERQQRTPLMQQGYFKMEPPKKRVRIEEVLSNISSEPIYQEEESENDSDYSDDDDDEDTPKTPTSTLASKYRDFLNSRSNK